MDILIELRGGIQGEVPAVVLDRLLELNLVSRFKREDGWVVPGRDPVRRKRPPVISLPERRRAMLQSAGLDLFVDEVSTL